MSIGFLVAYAIYWVGVTAVGVWICRWPMHFLWRVVGKVPLKAPAALPADYKIMWSIPVWVVAAVAITTALLFFRFSTLDLVRYVEIVVLQGFGGGLLLLIRRRLNFQGSGLSVTPDKRDTDVNEGALRRTFAVVLALWIAFPFFLVPNNATFVDTAFRIAQLRKDHAVVHVRSPWDTRLVQSGLTGAASFLGPDYTRFGDIRVSLRSIGRRVVLQVPGGAGKSQFIGIPRDYIEVE